MSSQKVSFWRFGSGKEPSSNSPADIGSYEPSSNHSADIESFAHKIWLKIDNRDSPNQSFITRHALSQIWTEDELQKFSNALNLRWGKNEIVQVKDHLLKTFSILVSLRWDKWHQFSWLFIGASSNEKPKLGDTDDIILQLSQEEIESGLGPIWAFNFRREIFLFNPVIIRVGKNSHPNGSRLPFLIKEKEEDRTVGQGGYGKVIKETIAPYQYKDENDDFNKEPIDVARKCFQSKQHFDRESSNLKILLESPLDHRHILKPLAMIESELSILSDLAHCNLETFLTETPEDHMSDDITLKSLLVQAESIAHALHYLHSSGSGKGIYHMDLTPANILIKWNGSRRQGAGHWLISDFGLSRQFSTPWPSKPQGEISKEHSRIIIQGRGPSTYQPPEASYEKTYSARSDVWSFGCILSRVFCRKLYGVQGLKDFDHQRGRLHPQKEREYKDDYFFRDEGLNPYVQDLIYSFLRSDCAMTKACGNLLERILCFHKDARLNAKEVHRELKQIQELSEDPFLPNKTYPEIQITRSTPRDTGKTSLLPLRRMQNHKHTPSRTMYLDPGGPSHQWIVEPPPTTSILDESDPPEKVHTPEVQLDEKAIKDDNASLILNIKNKDNTEKETMIHLRTLFRSRHGTGHLNLKMHDTGETAIGLAAEKGYTEVVEFLLENGAMVDQVDGRGNTPLMVACKKGHDLTVKTLLTRIQNPNIRGEDGKLLPGRANPNLQGEDGNTCLHFAARSLQTEILKLFKTENISLEVDKTNDIGRTALEDQVRGATQSRHGVIEALLELGADPDYREADKNRETARRLADHEHRTVRAIFKRWPPRRLAGC